MGKTYAKIDNEIKKWVEKQKMFFISTAPLTENGHVNCSPKGHDTLKIVDSTTLLILDYGGSGVETIAHLRENGRIVIMLCAFEGAPKIFRFHGTGEVITPSHADFEPLKVFFTPTPLGIRAFIKVTVTRISDSCGFGVPHYEFSGQRDTSIRYIETAGPEKIRDYLKENNHSSLDGLPGISAEEAEDYYYE